MASSQMPTMISDGAAARETNNENKYRQRFTELLSRSDVYGGGERENSPKLYEGETKLVKEAAQLECNAIGGGIVVGVAAFASLRYLPNFLIKTIGGEAKAIALREAEEAAKKTRAGRIQKAFGLFFESAFGAWSGWKGYQRVSTGQENTYEKICTIPLVAGRSALSENLCSEWTQLTYQTIPPAFWKNLDREEETELEVDSNAPKLKDPKTWSAIRKFAENCLKRQEYEKHLRHERGLDDKAPVAIPSPGVPESQPMPHIVAPLTVNEAETLVSDDRTS